MAKNSIFSGKDRFGVKKSPKSLSEILNTEDITTLDYDETQRLKRYVNARTKEIHQRAAEHPEYPTSEKAGTFKKQAYGSNPSQLFNELMRQEQFFNEYDTDRDLYENKDKYENVEKLVEDDKWRVIRMLAVYDPRLNYDRAYASETLKDIEREIEQNPYRTVEDVVNDMRERREAIERENANWNRGMRSFQDDVLAGNKGFHGVKKAWEKYNRDRTNIDNYSPLWSWSPV